MNELGKLAEELTAQHYVKLGFRVLDKNFIQRFGKQMGELDLVLTKDKAIVFVEVKARRSSRFGSGPEAVDFSKQRKLVNMVKLYLNTHPQYQSMTPRIDVADVDIDNRPQPVIILENVIEDLY